MHISGDAAAPPKSTTIDDSWSFDFSTSDEGACFTLCSESPVYVHIWFRKGEGPLANMLDKRGKKMKELASQAVLDYETKTSELIGAVGIQDVDVMDVRKRQREDALEKARSTRAKRDVRAPRRMQIAGAPHSESRPDLVAIKQPGAAKSAAAANMA